MTYQYQVAGRPVSLEMDENLVGVRYSEPAPHSARAEFAEKAGVDFRNRFEIPNEKFTVLKDPSNTRSLSVVKSVENESRENGSGIARVAPVFRMGNIKVLATDRVLVGLKNPEDPIKPFLNDLRTTDIKSRGYGEYTVHLADDLDPLQVAQELAAHPAISYAEPDFVNIGEDTKRSPGDATIAHDPRQQMKTDISKTVRKQYVLAVSMGDETWQLQTRNRDIHITVVDESAEIPLAQDSKSIFVKSGADPYLNSQYAATITMAQEAWKLQAGDPDIRIAILDEGVDTRHEDLQKAIVASYDAADEDEFQEPNPWDGHGTACAGLAAAIPNNDLGIRGIGGGCSLIAVRIAYSGSPDSPWVTTNSGIASAVEWAWRNKADVLSNSWGGGAPSNAIANAFERARTKGRDGKGCVIVVAAGNDNGAVSFPASLPGVLAVSASNEYDEFKTKDTKDGEYWWGSNFGPEVSIAAPGVHNYTTDITGPSGYNTTGNYYPSFNGTSSATPIVAGAAGLVLSTNPKLTEEKVREVLCLTADKVGKLQYSAGRNDQFGFGRLNVLKAVQATQRDSHAS